MFRFAVLFVTPLGNARAVRCNACVMSGARSFASAAGRVPEEWSPPARALLMADYGLSVAFLATVIRAWNPGEYFILQEPKIHEVPYRYLGTLLNLLEFLDNALCPRF